MSDSALTIDAIDVVYDPQQQSITTNENAQYAMDDAFNAISNLQSYIDDIKYDLEQI